MTMAKSEIGVSFSCTKCDQNHWFGVDGYHSQIRITLWPSNPAPKYRRDSLLPGRLAEHEWNMRARLVGGLITQAQYDENIADARMTVMKELDAINVALTPWWRKALARWSSR